MRDEQERQVAFFTKTLDSMVSGTSLGAIPAALTVTFFRNEPDHLLLPGRMLCGEIAVTDIGIAPSVLDQIQPDTFQNDPELWLSAFPRPQDGGNKYTRGHALISGGYPMTGAARMAARAAARVGAGLTTVVIPEVALPIYAAALTSIMAHPIASPEDFDDLLRDKRVSAIFNRAWCGIG
jgi:NAD(P)H-hydrate epimerase